MSNYSALKTAIQQAVYTNGNNEITGAGLQAVLLQIVNTVGDGYVFKGVATAGTAPGTPDAKVFYIAPAGTYTNFGSSYTVPVGRIGVFYYDGSWVKTRITTYSPVSIKYNGTLSFDTANNSISISGGSIIYPYGRRTSVIDATVNFDFSNGLYNVYAIIYNTGNGTLYTSTITYSSELLDNESSIIVATFFLDGAKNVTMVQTICAKTLIDGLSSEDTIFNNIINSNKLKTNTFARHNGTLEIDTSNNTISLTNNGVFIYSNGQRTQAANKTIEYTLNASNVYAVLCKPMGGTDVDLSVVEVSTSTTFNGDYLILATFFVNHNREIERMQSVCAKVIVNGHEQTFDFLKQISNVQSNRFNKCVLFEDTKDLSSEFNYTGFSESGESLISNGNSLAVYKKRYISDQRKAKFIIHFGSTIPNEIIVGSTQSSSPSSIKYSTCCKINIQNGLLIIYRCDGRNGQNAFPSFVLASTNIKQSISPNTDYIIELERDRKKTTLRLINYLKGSVDEVTYDASNVTFMSGPGNHRPYYFINIDVPGVIFKRFSIIGCYDVAICHVGDSLSESNGRADSSSSPNKNWIEYIMDDFGGNGCIVAQSGMSASDAITALTNEVAKIKPKILSVMIGTNGGITTSQVQQFIGFAQNANIPIFIHHVPSTSLERQSTETNSSNVINATIDAANVRGAMMDIATCIDGDISKGADEALYNSDHLHINSLGNIKMYERAKIDIEELVNF